VTTRAVSWSNLLRTTGESYLYGGEALYNFTSNFKFNLSAVTLTASFIERINILLMSNSVTNYTDLVSSKSVSIGLMVVGDNAEAAVGEYQVRVFEIRNDGLQYFGSRVTLSTGQDYYAKLTKSGTGYTVQIYSNPGRSILVGASSLTLNTNYSFYYALASQCYGGETNGYASSGSLSDLTLEITNASEGLNAEFITRQASTWDIYAKAVISPHNAEDLLGVFHIRAGNEDLPAAMYIGPIIYEDGSNNLYARFRVNQGALTAYDLSKTEGIGFSWWANHDDDSEPQFDSGAVMADFEVETPTGSYTKSFGEGHERWIWVGFTWKEMDVIGVPDLSQVIGYYWTYHTPGTRKLGVLAAWVPNDLLGKVTVRHTATEDLKCVLVLKFPDEELYAKMFVNNEFTLEIPAEFHIGYRADIYCKMLIRQMTSDRFAQFVVAQGWQRLSASFTLRQNIRNLHAEFVVND